MERYYDQCWIYFHHLDEYVYIPYFPESMQDTMQSTFAQTNALARTAPVVAYSYSGPRTVNFQINMVREDFNKLNETNTHKLTGQDNSEHNELIDKLIRHIQAIALPKYQANTKLVVPPMITVSIGGDIQIKGVVNGTVTVGYSKQAGIDFNGDSNEEVAKGRYNLITIQFTVTEVDPYDAESVLEVGGFRPGILPGPNGKVE